jgi:translation initiation factor IF-2
MAENKNDSDKKKTLSISSKTLELKKTVDAGQIRQSFAHGRTKSVAFEVKKKRSLDRSSLEQEQKDKVLSDLQKKTGLTESEIEARLRILKEAQIAEDQTEKERSEGQAKLAEIDAKRAEELAKRKSDEEERKKREAEEALKKPEKEQQGAEAPATKETFASEQAKHKVGVKQRADSDEEDAEQRKAAEHKRTLSLTKRETKHKFHRMTMEEALTAEEEGQRQRSLASLRRLREKRREQARGPSDLKPILREVVLPEIITVQELSNRMAVRAAEVIKKLMSLGVVATLNQTIDADTAELVVSEFGHSIRRVSESDIEIGLIGEEDTVETQVARAPVVTVMGHVDHGKTSLLDAIRQSDVVSTEAGGITQHIGAYQVTLPSGQKITFVDTPGHAAFSEMRARGANVTDIVVLVVAADDGIKEQTIEAINHAKAAEVPIMVAINKIDKPDANPTRVRNELLQHGLVPEDMGGEVPCVEVSAKQKLNIDKLEETILLMAELLELKANPDRFAVGTVIESKVDKGRGPMATILVQRGTLKIGDIFVAGLQWGRVRALVNEKGQALQEAGPSVPVEVLGFSGVPDAGESFAVLEDEARAREIAEYRERQEKQKKAVAARKATLEQLFTQSAEGEGKELAVIIKSDVQGSVEAITSSIAKIESQEVVVKVLHSGVGGINESDVALAQASHAMIVGFNVRANTQARDLASKIGVEIRYYSIIYNLLDDIKALLSGMLTPTLKENFLGYADIRNVFNITKVGKVAGCYVTGGVVKRGAKVRLLRDNIVIHEGTLKSLKRFKDEVKEVKEGYECGMVFENYQDIREGDVIECFEVEKIARTI